MNKKAKLIALEDSLLRLDPGDEIISSIKEYCKNARIKSGLITGLGAVASFEVGYYDVQNQEFLKIEVNEGAEIANLTGIVTWVDDQPHVHLHGTFVTKDMVVHGGHVNNAVISATGEIWIKRTSKISRKHDPKTGLNILDIE